MSEIAIATVGTYGAIDLKKSYKRNLRWALWIAVLLHFAGVGAYWLTIYLQREEEPTVTVRILKYSELGPPPSISDQNASQAVSVAAPSAKPTIGLPVAVPDEQVSPEQTIATQAELSQVSAPVGDGTGTGTQIGNDLKIDDNAKQEMNIDDGPPPDFVAYEKEPTIVKQVQPKYPDLAVRAGLEGTVYVSIWVDKEGKARKAKIVKSDADVFNQAAIDAAMQWVFTPALQQKKPIDLWIVIPFKFKLEDAK